MSFIFSCFSSCRTKPTRAEPDPISSQTSMQPNVSRVAQASITQVNEVRQGCCRRRPRFVERTYEHQVLSHSLRKAEEIHEQEKRIKVLSNANKRLEGDLLIEKELLEAVPRENEQLKEAKPVSAPDPHIIMLHGDGTTQINEERFHCHHIYVQYPGATERSFEEVRWESEAEEEPASADPAESGLQESVQDLRQEVDELERALEQANNQNNRLNDQIDDLESVEWRSKMIAERNQIQDENANLRDEISELSERNVELVNQNRRLRSENESLRTLIRAREERSLRDEMDQKDARNRILQQTLLHQPAQRPIHPIAPQPTQPSSSRPVDTVTWLSQILSQPSMPTIVAPTAMSPASSGPPASAPEREISR